MTNPITIKRVFFCIFSVMFLLPVLAADLKTYKDVYQKNSEDILQSYQPKFAEIQQQYQESLEALRTQVQSQGDLNKTKAAVAEIARFQKAKSLPATPNEKEIPEIQALQSDYVKQFADFEKEMASKLSALSAKYVQALDLLSKELVRAGKLDEATTVQEELAKAHAATKDFAGQTGARKEGPTASNVRSEERRVGKEC